MASNAPLPEASIAVAGGAASFRQSQLQPEAAAAKSQPGSVHFAGQSPDYENVLVSHEGGPGAGPTGLLMPVQANASKDAAPVASWTSGNEKEGLEGQQEPRVLVAAGEAGEQQPEQLAFSEASVRRAFIRKVFGILSAQLLLTALLVLAFAYVPELRGLARESLVFWLVSLYVVLSLLCSSSSASYSTIPCMCSAFPQHRLVGGDHRDGGGAHMLLGRGAQIPHQHDLLGRDHGGHGLHARHHLLVCLFDRPYALRPFFLSPVGAIRCKRLTCVQIPGLKCGGLGDGGHCALGRRAHHIHTSV